MGNLWGIAALAGALACWGEAYDGDELPVPVCEEGDVRCDGRLLELCTGDGARWTPLEACASPELCDAEPPVSGCLSPVCSEGESRCDGDMYQRCAAGGADWVAIELCRDPVACDPLTGCQL